MQLQTVCRQDGNADGGTDFAVCPAMHISLNGMVWVVFLGDQGGWVVDDFYCRIAFAFPGKTHADYLVQLVQADGRSHEDFNPFIQRL